MVGRNWKKALPPVHRFWTLYSHPLSGIAATPKQPRVLQYLPNNWYGAVETDVLRRGVLTSTHHSDPDWPHGRLHVATKQNKNEGKAEKTHSTGSESCLLSGSADIKFFFSKHGRRRRNWRGQCVLLFDDFRMGGTSASVIRCSLILGSHVLLGVLKFENLLLVPRSCRCGESWVQVWGLTVQVTMFLALLLLLFIFD